MASALQCPACGFKHRLSALSGEPVFRCAQCGRLLKTPAEYRRPEPSGPSEPPRPTSGARVQRGGLAARDQTSVFPTAGAKASKPRRPAPRAAAEMTLPLRILAWVVAVGLGAYIVRYIARAIGWLTGDSLIDVITGSGIGRYLRIFVLVPFWALATTLLATLFIEGGRWWMKRRALAPARPVRPPRPAAGRVPAAPPSGRTSKRSEPPARQPAPRPAVQSAGAAEPRPPAQSPPTKSPPAASPAAAETRSPTGAAGTQRARRIPRRDVSP